MCRMIGLLRISTMGLGGISVSSANLDPSPPAWIPTIITNLQHELLASSLTVAAGFHRYDRLGNGTYLPKG